jgi:nitroreductase
MIMSHAGEPTTAKVSPARAASHFSDLALRRRSIRRYRPQPVERGLLRELVDIATRAPSNFNRQPWQFIILDDRAWIAALHAVLRRGIDQVEHQDRTGEMYNLLDHVRTWLGPLDSCAAVILAFYKPSPERLDQLLSQVLEGGDVAQYNPNLVSLSMAIENLLLAAAAHGLGACMHSGPLAFLRGVVNRLLHLPDKLELAGLITLGWPDETPGPPRHRDLSRVLSFCEGPVPPEWSSAWVEESGT